MASRTLFGRSFSTSYLKDPLSPEYKTRVTSVRSELTFPSPHRCPRVQYNSDRQLREDYQNLLSVDPRLVDVLHRKPTAEAAKLLTFGRDAFRTSEVHVIVKEIPLWPTGHNIPASKMLRGVNNDICGGLLCPPSLDWDDPT